MKLKLLPILIKLFSQDEHTKNRYPWDFKANE